MEATTLALAGVAAGVVLDLRLRLIGSASSSGRWSELDPDPDDRIPIGRRVENRGRDGCRAGDGGGC